MYSPLIGQFAQRDPLGYAAGDANLLRYCGNRAVSATDFMGLWGPDFHIAASAKLAEYAGINPEKAKELSRFANNPDEDESDPVAVGVRYAAIVANQTNAQAMLQSGQNPAMVLQSMPTVADWKEIIRLLKKAQEWHFPLSADGAVHGGNSEGWKKVKEEIDPNHKSSLLDFGRALHVLQDSWAHQGTPYISGSIGHGRGVEVVPATTRTSWEWQPVYWNGPGGTRIAIWDMLANVTIETPESYKLLTGAQAMASSTTDDPRYFAADAVSAGMDTYRAILEFKKCHPELLGKTTPEKSEFEVQSLLKKDFPGVKGDSQNAVKWPPQ